MKITIGKKLGIGFGIVIGLFAISAGTVYYNVTQIQENLDDVLGQAVPTVRSCDRLLSELNEGSAALRGYLASTSDSKQAELLLKKNSESWDNADKEVAKLASFAEALDDTTMRQQVKNLARLINEQHDYHKRILQMAGTNENFPALQMFKRDVEPRIAQALELLTQIFDEEVTLEASSQRRQLLKELADVRTAYGKTVADLAWYVSQGDKRTLQELEKTYQSSGMLVQAIQQSADRFTSTQRQNWDQFLSVRKELTPLQSQLITMRSADEWNKADKLWLTEAAPHARGLRNVLKQIADRAEERRVTERQQLHASSQTTVEVLAIATLLTIVVGTIIAVFLTRSMVNTVRTLAERAQQISEGDLRGAAVISKGADELSQLADGFNVMMSNLRDLTGQILSVTENVNSAASQISSSARQQASSTKEQAATVQEITSTMEEISQSGAQIVSKAKEVAAVAEQASTASKSGMDAVQNTNRAMEAIREQVEEVAENIVALSEKTQAIGEIISTVNEIAEQSNLLALNATIEAAEAGEEGNRFSVVASEMKNLADQAKECTVHVRKILSEIQKAINTSVMLTEEAVKRVESGKQQADVSENVIRQISSSTQESIQAFQQIIAATNQQQVGLEQASRGMQDIDQAAQQTATGTGQLEQAVASLSAMGEQLKTAVASYKV